MTDAISEGYAVKDGSYAWASTTRAHGMPTPEDLEAEGYTRGPESPQYPGTYLMIRRPA